MKSISVILTHTGLGWNFAVLRNGRALPAEDPQDLPNAGMALQAALSALRETVRIEHGERVLPGENTRG